MPQRLLTHTTPGVLPHLLHGLLRGLPRLPSTCAVCHAWPSLPICDACVARFAAPIPRCRRCALPVQGGAQHCGECVLHPPPLDACFTAVSYHYPWAECISSYKFKGHTGWARPFALLMRSTPWVEPALEQADLLIPLPLAAQRLRERGFNQSLELAKALSRAKTDAHLLLRIQHTPPQSNLKRSERLKNVRNAFAIEPLRAKALQGKRVVLIDDVMTSGASLFAAAQVLRTAGVRHVTGLVFARTDP